MIRKLTLYMFAAIVAVSAYAQPIDPNKPKLVVNIVVSGMRAVDLERYQSNLGTSGLRLLYEKGLRYNNCQYSYQQTLTPVSLSTLATGAQPSTHGVVGSNWFDYVTNESISLVEDAAVTNLEYMLDEGGSYSAHNLNVPTVSDALLVDSPQSQAVTVALDPASSIMLGGRSGMSFWFDSYACSWASSTAFMDRLPQWAIDYNHSAADIGLTAVKWTMTHHSDLYVNSQHAAIKGGYILRQEVKTSRSESREDKFAKYYKQIVSTPIGNTIVATFAKMSVASLNLGSDDNADILNICFDASRNIVEKYGPESIEAEDMYYKLDKTIAELIDFVDNQVGKGNVIYILTSDHGTSPAVDVDATRFNFRQFEVILNGFLSVRYGNDSWVLGCVNGAVYLNHNAIYKHGLNLAEVQNEAATFALQLDGISHAVSSTALSSSYYGNGFAQKIQNGFYQRRSGDVLLNLMPNWIEKDGSRLSQSGSMYNYDRAVPLIIYREGLSPQVVVRDVDPISVAPTIAAMLGISEPAASEGRVLDELAR